MPNGRPGDHPINDMLAHGMHPFPCDIEAMIRKLHETDPEFLNFFYREFDLEPWEWVKRRGLKQARERLGALLIRNGLDPRRITRKAILRQSFYLVGAMLFFCSGALLYYLAYRGIFVPDLGSDFMKWIYPAGFIITGTFLLIKWTHRLGIGVR